MALNSSTYTCPEKRNTFKQIGIVTLLYGLLSIIATYPLIVEFNQTVLGGGDTTQNVWNLWWVRHSLEDNLFFPFHTNYLYHPEGVSLAYHPLGVVNGWLGAILQAFLGLNPVATYNSLTLLSFILSGLFTYLLIYEVSGNFWVAFSASILFCFSPFRMSRVNFGNLEMFSLHFPVLAIYGISAFISTGKIWFSFLAAIGFALTAGTSLYLAYSLAIFLFVLIAWHFWHSEERAKVQQKNFWLGVGLFTLFSILLSLPFLLPLIYDSVYFAAQSNQHSASIGNSADLLGFLLPHATPIPTIYKHLEPLWTISQQTFFSFSGNLAEKTVFVGYATLLVSFCSLFLPRQRERAKWYLLAALLGLLCLGPTLHLGGQPRLTHLPYEWLSSIPLVSFGRSPSRMAAFLMLALAVAVAKTIADLPLRPRLKNGIAIVFGVVTFLEFLVIPIRTDARFLEVPSYYEEIFKEQHAITTDTHKNGTIYTRKGVLNIPLDLYGAAGPASDYMLFQLTHQLPIVSGYISRTPQYAIARVLDKPFLRQLRVRIYNDNEERTFDQQIVANAAQEIDELSVNYIFLHKSHLSTEEASDIHRILMQLYGPPCIQEEAVTGWILDKACSLSN